MSSLEQNSLSQAISIAQVENIFAIGLTRKAASGPRNKSTSGRFVVAFGLRI